LYALLLLLLLLLENDFGAVFFWGWCGVPLHAASDGAVTPLRW
jgi:hypothetical protein